MPIDLKIKKLKKAGREYRDDKPNLLIYPSKGGVEQNLNAQGKDSEGEAIVCRQLAAYVASKNTGIKDYHEDFRDVGTIESIPFLKGNEFDKQGLHFKSESYKIFSIDALGKVLNLLAWSLKEGKQKTFVVYSENHAMALSLSYKKSDDGKPEYIIKFYDPNKTNQHIRVMCDDISALKNLSMSDFMDEWYINSYFPRFKTMVFSSSKQRNLDTLPVVGFNCSKPPDGTVYFLLLNDLLKGPEAILETILTSEILNATQKIALLDGKDSTGVPGFYMALQEGHSKTVKVYLDAILTSEILNATQKIALLEAKSRHVSTGVPGTWQNFAEWMLDFADSQVKDSTGTPGFYMALQNGHPKTVKVYLDAILASEGLDATQKIALLEAKRSTGPPGFFMALQEGHPKTVKVYVETILASEGLDATQKIGLLEAKRSDGTPGFYVALQNGHSETVKVYVETILASEGLDATQKIALLDGKDSTGTPGFFMALQKGHSETVKVYLDAILTSESLDVTQKIALLEAKRRDGDPGFFMALHNGHPETVKVYVETILASESLNATQKIALLKVQGYNQWVWNSYKDDTAIGDMKVKDILESTTFDVDEQVLLLKNKFFKVPAVLDTTFPTAFKKKLEILKDKDKDNDVDIAGSRGIDPKK